MISTNVHNLRMALGDVKLIAVSKGRTVPEIRLAREVGVKAFGENRMQEALPKIDAVKDVEWHFIGKLQSNKVRKAVESFKMIQSVDSIGLAERIDKAAADLGKRMEILLQVNFSKDGRQGFSEKEIVGAVKRIKELPNIDLQGMMMVAPLKKEPKPYFIRAKKLFDKHNFKYLSMGMTEDWKKAIKCGANMVRIGRGVFS
jgi:pyridoxal phosphate enzyme (YggS family)